MLAMEKSDSLEPDEDKPLIASEQELHDLPASTTASSTQFIRQGKLTRVWPATYACTVVAFGFLLFGFTMGFNSPVLSSLKSKKGFTSLRRTLDQDLFNVSYCGAWSYISSVDFHI